jgi:hypothetical protein
VSHRKGHAVVRSMPKGLQSMHANWQLRTCPTYQIDFNVSCASHHVFSNDVWCTSSAWSVRMKTNENSLIRDGYGGFFSRWVLVKSNPIESEGLNMK